MSSHSKRKAGDAVASESSSKSPTWYGPRELYPPFCDKRQNARRRLIDQLTELQKLVDERSAHGSAAAAAAAVTGSAASASAASPTATCASVGSAVNAGTYNLYLGLRADIMAKFANVDDVISSQNEARFAVQSLAAIEDEKIADLARLMERELRYLTMVVDIRNLSRGMTVKSTEIAVHMSDAIKDMIGDVTDDNPPESPSYNPTSPSYSPTSPSYQPLQSDSKSASEARALPVCAGCDEKKKCGKINAMIESGTGGTNCLRFYFGFAYQYVNNRKYSVKGQDWLCCRCAIPILRILSREETLGDQKHRFEIDADALAVNDIDCGCSCCRDCAITISQAFDERILYSAAGGTSKKKAKVEPVKASESAAAATAPTPASTPACASASASASASADVSPLEDL
jgi:hypothetical protein